MTTHHRVDRRDAILAKLSEKTVMNDRGCWLWVGPTSGNGRGGGYGRVSINGQTCAVHLVSYTHFYGYIPGNREVDHDCNCRSCWNPEHLRLVTRTKNERLKRKRERA
jgi:hypothetical protein